MCGEWLWDPRLGATGAWGNSLGWYCPTARELAVDCTLDRLSSVVFSNFNDSPDCALSVGTALPACRGGSCTRGFVAVVTLLAALWWGWAVGGVSLGCPCELPAMPSQWVCWDLLKSGCVLRKLGGTACKWGIDSIPLSSLCCQRHEAPRRWATGDSWRNCWTKSRSTPP